MTAPMLGRAHNVQPGDALYLTDRGWVDVRAVGATTTAAVLLEVSTYGAAADPVPVALPWDAPVVVVVPG